MVSLFVVDDVVFSEECFNWFNEREHLAQTVVDSDLPIDAFRFLLPEKYIDGKERKDLYQELDAGEFWVLLNEIFMLMTDIHKTKKLPVKFSVQDIRIELLKTEKMILFWALSQSHKPTTIGKLPEVYITSDGMMNNRYCLDAFHIASANKWGLDRLDSILYGRIANDFPRFTVNAVGLREYDDVNDNEFQGDNDGLSKFIKDLVRLGYGGDFDEFIINVKDKIASNALGPYHYKMALARGYELMGITDFSDVDPSEAWRRLFTTYFDGDEDNYDIFYNTYPHQCIVFLLLDYLSIDKGGGVDYIPIYKIYSNNGFKKSYTEEMQTLLNTKLIRQRLFKLFKKKIK